ncbi:hypothetical protein ABVK25_012282 [Lepraria finkii]|uniref:Uncharacterized protein n=1 Tax=Lepraria finkii TaxID=1340010 RepID=A0ABR4AMH9_9LECA
MRSSVGIALLALCGNALGARVPVPEVRRMDLTQRDPKPELDKRITCIEDDYLLSLQMYIEDSYPSCSAFLGIPETTTTSTETARTTVIVLQTTYQTFQAVTTLPSTTTTVTTVVPNTLAGPNRKRQEAGVTPAASIFSQLVPSRVSRLLKRNSTVVDTVTEGESTVYYTVKPTSYGSNPNQTTTSTGSIPSPTFSTGNLSPVPPSSSTPSSPNTSGSPSASVSGSSVASSWSLNYKCTISAARNVDRSTSFWKWNHRLFRRHSSNPSAPGYFNGTSAFWQWNHWSASSSSPSRSGYFLSPPQKTSTSKEAQLVVPASPGSRGGSDTSTPAPQLLAVMPHHCRPFPHPGGAPSNESSAPSGTG